MPATFLDATPSSGRGDLRVGRGFGERGLFPERTPEQDAADLAAARAWAQTVFDAGFGWISGPPAYGGRGLPREYQRIYHGRGRRATPRRRWRPTASAGHGGTDHPGPRHRGGEAGLPAEDVPRGHRGVPAVQRAGQRLRPGLAPDPGGPRRRRVDRQRAEGLDLGRPVLRHRGDHLPDRPGRCPSTGA